MKGLLLLSALALSAPALAISFPFDEGRIPLNIGSGPRELNQGKSFSAEQCRNCHGETHAQWEHSRHRRAWTNEVFQDGLRAEPLPRCVFCHAPLDVQARELLPQLKHFSLTDRGKNIHLPVPRGTLSHEGVTCVVCHVREGTIHAAKPNPNALHDVRVDPSLSKPEFCANCHQFHFQGISPPPGQTLMQSTFDEWKAYAKAGGEGTCQSCHMPNGSHEFRGANDRAYLKQALQLAVTRQSKTIEFTLVSVGVGHSLPTGDLFRHVTFEIKRPEQDRYRVIKRWGREFVRRGDLKTLAQDTSIKPFLAEVWEVAEPEFSYRLVYHYGSSANEARATLPDSFLRETLAEGKIAATTAAQSTPRALRQPAVEFRARDKSFSPAGE